MLAQADMGDRVLSVMVSLKTGTNEFPLCFSIFYKGCNIIS